MAQVGTNFLDRIDTVFFRHGLTRGLTRIVELIIEIRLRRGCLAGDPASPGATPRQGGSGFARGYAATRGDIVDEGCSGNREKDFLRETAG